jgi:hypothetical protein
MKRSVLHCLDRTNLHSFDHGRDGSTKRISKCAQNTLDKLT